MHLERLVSSATARDKIMALDSKSGPGPRRLVGYLTVLASLALATACQGGAPAAPQAAQPAAAQPPISAPAQPPASQPSAPAASNPTAAPAAKPAASAPAAAAPAPAAAAPATPARLIWGATGSTSAQYAYAVAVAKEIRQKYPEIELTVSESGGADENIKRMLNGEIQVGNITSEAAAQSYNALEQFKDKPYKDLRMLWYFQQSVFHFVVSEQSGVTTLQGLDGKDFNPGLRGSSSEKTAERVLAALNVKPKYHRGDNNDALMAIRDRRIVGYVKAGAPPDPTILDLQTTTPLRILNFSKEELDEVRRVAPTVAIASVPANVYRNVPAFSTFATGLGVGVDKKVSADVAYKIVKAMWEARESIATAYKPLKDVNIPELTQTLAKTPLHEGAARYYREIGVTFPAEAQPPEAR
ncbi:MAG: TAXI family TRAP transporter solute-binding subunit [Chloroflexi bacterium]|nr:TAXI family TRAP transporter solute-binding subunit [Chloroflexota bacterium]